MSSTGDGNGTAILRGYPTHKNAHRLQGNQSTRNSQLSSVNIMTLIIDPAPRTSPAT